MTTRREMILAELDAWRREEALDEPTWRFLRSRYENAPDAPSLDTRLAPASSPTPGGRGIGDESFPADARRSFAADAMQFVGGLLVGVSLVALVIYLDLPTGQRPLTLFGLGLLLFLPAALGAWLQKPQGLIEAGSAGAFVPWVMAAGYSIDADTWLIPIAIAALAFLTLFRPHGGTPGPSTLVASGTYAFATAAATFLPRSDFFGEPNGPSSWLWMGLLLAYGGMLLVRRHAFWNNFALGLYVIPLSISFAALLELVPDLSSMGYEFAFALLFGALLAIGIPLAARGLVAGAAAGITIDAIAFSFDVGGPGTAVVVLLGLGGLLVWQAEFLRRYFRPRAHRGS